MKVKLKEKNLVKAVERESTRSMGRKGRMKTPKVATV
jgi:hypothetical protein